MLCLDLQYMVVTNSTHPTKKKQLDSCEVIGNPNASFTVNIPTASQVYSILRQVEKTGPDTPVTSFFEQSAHPVQVDGVATNVQEASAVLSTYDLSRQQSLYQALLIDCLANTPRRKPGES